MVSFVTSEAVQTYHRCRACEILGDFGSDSEKVTPAPAPASGP